MKIKKNLTFKIELLLLCTQVCIIMYACFRAMFVDDDVECSPVGDTVIYCDSDYEDCMDHAHNLYQTHTCTPSKRLVYLELVSD